MVTVSVITPCYNGAKYIERTIASVLGQTRPPVEMIVIDDGSTDESAAIAARFGAPVRVIRQANQGESVARNRGLAEAAGSHVLFLDADDLLAPEALERLAAAVAEQPGAVAIQGCAWFSGDPAHPDRSELPRQTAFYPAIIEDNFGPPHCWLAPVALVREAGGFCESMRWFEDWDLWWRVGLKAPALVPIPYVGALYRQHAQSQLATTSLTNRTRGHAALMTRMVSALVGEPRVLDQYGERLFWCGWTALSRARQHGVPWGELRPLAAGLRTLAARGPASVRQMRTAQAIRWFGARGVLAVQAR